MSHKSIKLSDFLKLEKSPFILGAFLSRIMEDNIDNEGYFYAYTSFKMSKFVHCSKFNFQDYIGDFIKNLNFYSGYNNWYPTTCKDEKVEARFYIKNDLQISRNAFYKNIYSSICSSDWALNNDVENCKNFLRGFMELRGSVDTTAKLLSEDYFYENKNELKKALLLTDLLDLPLSYINFNARDLQPQFLNGTNKRNAQLRINLYFYANKIGFLNKYKAEIFETAYKVHTKYEKNNITYFVVNVPEKSTTTKDFISYLNFFTNYIYKAQLTPDLIKKYRGALNFDHKENLEKETRDYTLINIFKEISEDKCAICGTTKTYETRNGRQYFEVHHVIPYCNGKEFDNLANLVKLCPNCHRMMKKGSGRKEDQRKAIYKILFEHSEIYEFASSYLQIDDINDLTDKILTLLG